MNEKYLHLIWKQQRFLSGNLTLTDGRALHIKYPGDFNEHLSGPDFEMGKIIVDEIEWCGPIELHVRASDWYSHNHQTDPAYQNVILHVVYENDAPVIIDGFEIPTLELKDHISITHYWQFSGLNPAGNHVICSRLLDKVDPQVIKDTLRSALRDKLKRKYNAIAHLNREEQFYRLLAASFGMSVNKEPFEDLTQSVPWSHLKPLSPSQQFHLLFVTSGLLSDRRNNVMAGGYKWNFKGTRPSNFPTKRMGQFAELVSRLPIDQLAKKHHVQVLDKLFSAYLRASDDEGGESLYSRQFATHLRINTIAPFVWGNNRDEREAVFDYLCSLEAEENAVIKKWRSFGVSVENAAGSQGLIGLDRNSCREKKCLSCGIGRVLLNTSE